MVNPGSLQHQDCISDVLLELRKKGYNVVDLAGKAPDLVACKDNLLYAVEVLLVNKIPKCGINYDGGIIKDKRKYYENFDEIIFKVYKREKKVLTKEEIEMKHRKKRARLIVNNMFEELKEVHGVK